MTYLGAPCWYELGTSDPAAASDFYTRILDWQIADSGLPGADYRLAKAGRTNVAGLKSNVGQPGAPPPNWLIYFAADDCAATLARVTQAGGKVLVQPTEIPGTGRFAVAADPQGAVFGLLEPDMSTMTETDRARAAAGEGAFDPKRPGHGQWNELMSSDPQAALGFYADLFGWTKGDTMDMGDMGTYQLVRRAETDIGAIMGLGEAPFSVWLPYFGATQPVTRACEAIKAAGGTPHHGPLEVPGPAYVVLAQDPQGAWFALVGPER